jgi:glycerol-3-phosphate acyltransferase PlsY
MTPALIVPLAYLIGSVPFGYLIAKSRGAGDIRQTGSGGTGATNVTRSAGRAAGVLTLFVWLFGGRHAAGVAPLLAAALAGAALIVFMHRANIGRLLAGTESKLK